MHIAETELRLTSEGIREAIAGPIRSLLPVTVEKVEIDAGQLRVRFKGEGFLPLPLTVKATVEKVTGERLTALLEVERLDFLPPALQNAGLELIGRQLRVPGLHVDGNQLTVNVTELPIPVRFELGSVSLEPGAVRVVLRNLTLDSVILRPGEGETIMAEAGAPEHQARDGESGDLLMTQRPERTVEDEHQAGYRAIRSRIHDYLDRRAPQWLQPAIPWLLMLPDFFVLLVRLARDQRVPGRAKFLALGVLGYIAMPFDLLPDALPGVGLLDDVAMALMALDSLITLTPPEVLHRHWPGHENVLEVVQDGIEWVSRYYPRPLLQRLRAWLQNTAERQGSTK